MTLEGTASVHVDDPEPADQALQDLLSDIASALSRSDESVASRAEIVFLGQKLLSLPATDHPGRYSYLEPLARALYQQFEATGEWDALEAAIDLSGEAIEDTEEGNDIEAARLGDLYSRCLRSRFMRGRNENDLENAIQFGKASVERTKTLDLDEKTRLLVERQNNLSLCYFTQAHQLDDTPPHILEDAIDLARDSLALVSGLMESQKLWEESASALGMYLQVRWSRNHQEEDIERSIELGYQWLDHCQAYNNAKGEAMSNLAFRLQRGYDHFLHYETSQTSSHLSRGKRLLDESIDLISQAMQIETERELSKLENTMTFTLYLKEFPTDIQSQVLSKIYPVLRDQVDLMERLAIMSNEADRRDLITTYYGLCRYAALAAVEAKVDPFEALRLLETGRGMMISIQTNYEENEDLALVDPETRGEYVSSRMSLKEAVDARSPFHVRQRLLNSVQDQRYKIRKLPSLEDFDRSLSKGAMLKLSQDGPIIVVNVTDLRCHAIIITHATIQAILLPEASEDVLSERSWEIQTLLAQEDRGHEASLELYIKFSAFLKDLWKWIALPIFTSQGFSEVPTDDQSWPHVWWILTGILALYPMHAAGVGLHSKKNNVMNRVISSYTPTLKALARSRSQYETQKRSTQNCKAPKEILERSITVVTMPDTPSRVLLEYAQKEGEDIKSLFPHAELMIAAEKEQVMKALARESTVMHFSCHGEVDYDFPLESKILLTDWEQNPMTVGDIQSLHLSHRQNSQVAFISACFTANAGVENLQDEMLHLVSALQLAGFMSVVGTLWDVQERSAYEVVNEFYSHLSKGHGNFDVKDVAMALHFAVLKFRESTRHVGNDMKGNPMIWAPFVHFGI